MKRPPGLIILMLAAMPYLTSAQDYGDLGIIVLEQVIVGDDTLPAITLDPVDISASLEKIPELDNRMKYHTRRAYPYSLRVSRIVN